MLLHKVNLVLKLYHLRNSLLSVIFGLLGRILKYLYLVLYLLQFCLLLCDLLAHPSLKLFVSVLMLFDFLLL